MRIIKTFVNITQIETIFIIIVVASNIFGETRMIITLITILMILIIIILIIILIFTTIIIITIAVGWRLHPIFWWRSAANHYLWGICRNLLSK